MIIKVKKKKKQMTNFPPRCAETSTTTAPTVTTITTMDSEQFRKYGKEMVDYIADYYDNIRQRPVIHNVSPGYLPLLLPCLLYTSPSPRDFCRSRMPSSA